jgi:3-hydroxyacyl-CoA dehydrogenase
MAASTGKDILPFLTEGFTAAAMAKVGTSALESRKLGYLLDSDVVVPHKDELLFVAINEAKAMFAQRLPCTTQAPVCRGRPQWCGHHQGQLVNMRDGGFISAHDFHIGKPDCRSGVWWRVGCRQPGQRGIPHGAGAQGVLLPADHPKTQERIMGMMSTGKPVRN